MFRFKQFLGGLFSEPNIDFDYEGYGWRIQVGGVQRAGGIYIMGPKPSIPTVPITPEHRIDTGKYSGDIPWQFEPPLDSCKQISCRSRTAQRSSHFADYYEPTMTSHRPVLATGGSLTLGVDGISLTPPSRGFLQHDDHERRKEERERNLRLGPVGSLG